MSSYINTLLEKYGIKRLIGIEFPTLEKKYSWIISETNKKKNVSVAPVYETRILFGKKWSEWGLYPMPGIIPNGTQFQQVRKTDKIWVFGGLWLNGLWSSGEETLYYGMGEFGKVAFGKVVKTGMESFIQQETIRINGKNTKSSK